MGDPDRAPIDLELVRTRDDRRTYALGDVGTLRLEGFWARNATATAGDRSWQLVSTSRWTTASMAADEGGAEAGSFVPRAIRRGGTLTWGARTYALQPASSFRERYALLQDDVECALFDGRGWGRRPVGVTLAAGWQPDPGLLLYAAFVVRALAEASSSTAAGAATVAATGAC